MGFEEEASSLLQNHELSERKKQILKAIVDEYISGGEPVGSKYLLQSNSMTCSAATIRNEMAELEEMGYLEQPHTSAGRVPSELGYRFYVDSLIKSYAITAKEIEEINHLMKVKAMELDNILETASKLASALTNYTGIAVKPRASAVTITKFNTIPIDDYNFILVMITSTGAVKTKHVKMLQKISVEDVNSISDMLNKNISGMCVKEITLPMLMKLEQEAGANASLITPIIKAIYQTMEEFDNGELRLSGLNRLLQYPEYSDKAQLGELITALEQKDEIIDLIEEGKDDINVFIGSESSVEVMNNSAIVFKPIKKDGKTVGAVGVIGPRRMDYAKVLATIEGLAGNISGLIEDNVKLLKEREKENDDG